MNAPAMSIRAADLLRPAAVLTLEEWASWAGRVSEVSEERAAGALTWMAGLMEQVQDRGEQTVWISAANSLFFPPDLAYRGLDLAAITVVDVRMPQAALQAAEWLLRSAAFGLVVIDGVQELVTEAGLGRLVRLAAGARTGLVFLTRKSEDTPSLGSQVGLRVAVKPGGPGTEVVALKNRGHPLSRTQWTQDGPMGLY